jgi:hypothetical protein
MPNIQRLLELALRGLQADRARIDDEIVQIKSQLKGSSLAYRESSVQSTTEPRKRRTMSVAARRRISEGMKRRHAALRAGKAKPDKSVGLTAAGRKKLSIMMKARWAAKKRAGKQAA